MSLYSPPTTDQAKRFTKVIIETIKAIEQRQRRRKANDERAFQETVGLVIGDLLIGYEQEGNNPEVIIQSPTLDSLFEFYDEIDTEIELTDLGIKVSQTSNNPLVVKLLQTHAAEVSDMSERGMKAVHERMAKAHH